VQDQINYQNADHANTHGQLQPGPERSSPAIDADFETLMRDGYVIIEGLLSQAQCDAIKADGLALLDHTGRNAFEGLRTQRVYDGLSKTRQPLGAATVWAIDDFTPDNGATVIIPGSHTWGDDRAGTREEAIPAVMPAGSVMFFLGTTWHGGGENRTDAARFAITHQYCEAYLRQQENYLLELSRERVRAMTPELQSLVGYNIYPPFMGMVNGMHPLRVLDEPDQRQAP
jgi:hypothetical protein